MCYISLTSLANHMKNPGPETAVSSVHRGDVPTMDSTQSSHKCIQEKTSKGINAACRIYSLCSAWGPRSLLEELPECSCLVVEIPPTAAEPRIQG